MKVLFSGRFDEPHPGHWMTILKLLMVFNDVVVVILDYPERTRTAKQVKRDFESMAVLSGEEVFSHLLVLINTTHFAKLTREEWDAYGCDVYAGGNIDVNNHMTDIGVPVYEQERSSDYSARNYKATLLNKTNQC